MGKADYKIYTLKELRESVGLNQQELGWAAGISSVYVSLIESGEKQLNYDTAEKLAEVYVRLMYERNYQSEYYSKEENEKEEYIQEQKIETEVKRVAKAIMANHLASFYPEDVQGLIVELMDEKQVVEDKLKIVLETGREPFELDEEIYVENIIDRQSLYDKVNHMYIDMVQKNVVKLKEGYKNKPKKGVKM